jgi:hypothetical protein
MAYGINVPTAFPKTLEIERTDSNITSAPAMIANLTQNQTERSLASSPALRSLWAHPSIWKRLAITIRFQRLRSLSLSKKVGNRLQRGERQWSNGKEMRFISIEIGASSAC